MRTAPRMTSRHRKIYSFMNSRNRRSTRAALRARILFFLSCRAGLAKPSLRANSALLKPSSISVWICRQVLPAGTSAASLTARLVTSRILFRVRFRICVRRPHLIWAMIEVGTSEAAATARRPTPCLDKRKMCFRAGSAGTSPFQSPFLRAFARSHSYREFAARQGRHRQPAMYFKRVP